MAKKMMYSFTEKKNSVNGIISTIMGGISLVFLLAMIYASYYMRGDAGIYAGAFGLCGLIFALAGFIVGIRSFSEKNIKYKYPKIGSVLSGTVFVIWLALYLIGV
ncbi:hypothetical protein BRYFOR_08013 [Marvinbryantia formatexigens DSM 14469]|uniref:Uncharacterized protein n=1 Tax=Marvinbryantia formatexigens DSM 14469 TaxID=478749 RepID=C6LHA3_9FIRM|nr:DUF6142 family protein [Marvinbryantia formatexigens]EET59890.1 hypothetical protein BRYFOR_08013 [Marvinbryantia formatexigens DSM 14469]UWO25934.1 DUF6142 family protein [Marvinbryantia formatexigens DSM 14469]SDF43615.1 hypothetical protein SAMN05660368_00754 [Marvinbryantia formatexigens]